MAEFSPGQFEINMKYGPALDSADRAFICKELTRALAESALARLRGLGG